MNQQKSFSQYHPNRVAQQGRYAEYASLDAMDLGAYCFGVKNVGGEIVNIHTDLSKEEIKARVLLFDAVKRWSKWHQAGRNVFDFSPGLLEMLGQTDVSNMDVIEFKLPYPSIYLDLSAAGLPFVEGHNVPIEGVYISEERGMHIYGGKGENDDREATVDYCLQFYFVGAYQGSFENIDRLLNRNTYFPEYELWSNAFVGGPYKVENAIWQAEDDYWNNKINDEQTTQTEDELEAEIDTLEVFNAFLKRTAHLVLNCLLYLMLPDKDVEQQQLRPDLPLALQKRQQKANTKKKQKAVQADIRALGFTRVNYVGRSVLRRAELAAGTGATVAPHWRRGHWRNQVRGAGRQQRQLMWIQPVVVNKKLGEPAKGRVYDVTP